MTRRITQVVRWFCSSERFGAAARRHARHSSISRRPIFEPLEGRNLPATLSVNSLLDNTTSGDGLVTLREAIAAANTNTITDLGQTGSGADTIQFDAGLSGTVNLITIGSTLVGNSALTITSPITILGNENGITLNAAAGATAMRHFYVSAGGSLTLETIMVTAGTARGAAGLPGENGSDGMGGAIYSQGTVNVIASTFYNNTAFGGLPGAGGVQGAGRGGAIYNASGAVTVRNATFSGNHALNSSENSANSSFGGSIFALNGIVDIANSTMTAGAAFSGKAVYIIASGGSAMVNVESTIMANAGVSEHISDFTALQEFESDTLIITASGNFIRRAVPLAGTRDFDPLLAPLGNYGGPTLTHALQTISEAINAGSNPLGLSTDQRGSSFARVVGGVADIGAYELQASSPALVGDFNRDSVVDAADFVMWQKTKNTNVEPYSGADANGDTQVNEADLALWTENFGEALGDGAGGNAAMEGLQLFASPVRSAALAGNLVNATVAPGNPQPRSIIRHRFTAYHITSHDAALLAVLTAQDRGSVGNEVPQAVRTTAEETSTSESPAELVEVTSFDIAAWHWI
jgi:hypothetical protein